VEGGVGVDTRPHIVAVMRHAAHTEVDTGDGAEDIRRTSQLLVALDIFGFFHDIFLMDSDAEGKICDFFVDSSIIVVLLYSKRLINGFLFLSI
jgi:hypothetical protein